jgi:APA family basic amino acid/polyamine antiporter
MLVISYGGGLVEQFEFLVQISVFAALVPYLFTAAAYILVLIEKKLHANSWVKTFVLGGLGFAYSLWAIWGSGRETVFYGFMLLLSGIPFYLLMQWNKRKK